MELGYVDGFLLVVPTARLAEYQAMSQRAGEIWREYGALDYRESVDDDTESVEEGMGRIRQTAQAGDDESVILAWITYPDRVARDRINGAVMADPRLQDACPEGLLDMKRFHWAGFRTLVREPMPTAPGGMATITPYLTCDGAAQAIAFYAEALGAQELVRLPAPDGRLLHAMIRVGDSMLMLADRFEGCEATAPGQGGVTLHLYVADVDAALARVVAAGGVETMPATDMFWGDRYARFRDPYGHEWALATQVRQVTPEEVQAAAAKMFGQGGDWS